MVIWQCMRPRPDSSRSSPAPVGRRPKMAQSDEARSAALVLAGVSRTVLARQQHITRQGLRARERTPGREGGLSIRAAVGAYRRRACPRRLRARWRRFDLGGLRRQRARRGRELLRAPAHRPKGEQHRAEGAVHSPSPSAVEASSSPSSCLLRDRRERRRGSGRGRRRGDRHARRPRRLRGLSRRRGNPHARRHRNRAQGAPGGVGAADGAADVANVEATTESTEAAAIAALSRRCCSRVGRVEAALSRRESDDLVRKLVGRDRRVENAGHGARRTR